MSRTGIIVSPQPFRDFSMTAPGDGTRRFHRSCRWYIGGTPNGYRHYHSDHSGYSLLGGFSGIGGGPFYGTGYYGGGGLGLIVVILLILVLMGRI